MTLSKSCKLFFTRSKSYASKDGIFINFLDVLFKSSYPSLSKTEAKHIIFFFFTIVKQSEIFFFA